MITKIPKILIFLVACCLPHQNLFSQHISRDNHKGNWEDALTWDPEWASPSHFISGYDITIDGYVTSEDLVFYNQATRLVVNDTLVINGDLYLNNPNDLFIRDGGILIVRGDFHFEEHCIITCNGYFIITGDVEKDNDHHLGAFTSNDNPPKVFIGGSVTPPQIINDFQGYQVLNCSNPVTKTYPNSGCSSGNMDDLKEDPLYSFFQSTCNFVVSPVSISVCPGDSIHLIATGGGKYYWKGPSNFRSILPDPFLFNADSGMSGIYTVDISADHDCEVTDTFHVLVNPKPPVSITSSDDILCFNSQRTLTGTPEGGTFVLEKGLGSITDNILKPYGLGEIKIKYLYTMVCSNTDSQTLVVNPQIRVSITSTNDTMCINEVRPLKGIPANGTFTFDKGPGVLTGNFLQATDSGTIYIKYLTGDVCSNVDSQVIVVNPPVSVSISTSDDTLCIENQLTLTGLPAGGIFTVENGPGLLTGNILKATNTGEIGIKYTYNKICAHPAGKTLVSIPFPDADAGADQEMTYNFETDMDASLHPQEKGTWSLVSGTGKIEVPDSPNAHITGLSLGENVFLWTASNGACESESKVTVTVLDLVIPSVFTPNGDGVNDNFYIRDYSLPYEITVFNQWGLIEYESHSLVDHWDGTNKKGNQLPPETYFYLLKFANGQVIKGTVLIVK
jgi:gliding motility-associated-like protein